MRNFNEGYDASMGEDLIRHELCDEAIRLARLLVELIPDHAESIGLLAMCLFSHARRDARTTSQGEVVLLDDQDRSRWDRAMIDVGIGLLQRARRLGRPGPLQVQAAIAGAHSSASSPEATEWGQIAALYEDLLALSPTAVVR